MLKKKIVILIFISCHLVLQISLVKADSKLALVGNQSDGFGIIKGIENKTEYTLQIDGTEKLNPGASKLEMNRSLTNVLSLSGYANDDPLVEFGPEKAVDLSPMWSKGYAWLTESLETPGKATLQFIASAGDGGNIQVVFGRAISSEIDLRITIGGWNNTKAAITYKDQILAETETKYSPHGGSVPGLFVPYWVSINNGFIIVGSGIQGTNIILSAFIPDFPAVNRIGFSTHETNVIYSQVSKSQTLFPVAPLKNYTAQQEPLALSSPFKPVDLSYPLRVMNEGSIVFNAQPKLPITILLSNTTKDRYKIALQPDSKTAVSIQKNDNRTFIINGTMPTSKGYWLSVNGGTFLMGLDNLGDNIFLAWEDKTPLKNITKVSFAGSQQTISDIQFSSPVMIGTKNESNPYEKPLERFDCKGDLAIIRPIGYDLIQDGQRVTLKDTVGGGLYPVIATPQQKAQYLLQLTVDKKGTPSVAQIGGPVESPQKINLEHRAALLDKTASQIKEGAEALFEASKAVGYATSNIVIFCIDAIGAAISLGLSGAGAGVWAAASSVAAQASRTRLEVQEGYRAHDSFVFTQGVTRDASGKVTIPQAAINNKKAILKLLTQVDAVTSGKIKEEEDLSFIFHDEDEEPESDNAQAAMKTEQLINLFNSILVQITHPYIIEDTSLKNNIIIGLTEISQSYQNFPALYDDCLKLFSRALANPLLLTDNSKQDQITRDAWYQTFINLGLALFTKISEDPTCSVTITPLQGEYLWLPGQLETPGKGWITFEVQGESDLLLCFSKDQSYVRKADNTIYECILGAYDNTCHEFHIQNLGRPAAKYIPTKLAALTSMFYPRRFKSFWLSLSNGTMKLGSGDIVDKKGTELLSWKDPFPWEEIKYIGISSWQAPIKIRNIKTSNVQAPQQSDSPATESDSQPQNGDVDNTAAAEA